MPGKYADREFLLQLIRLKKIQLVKPKFFIDYHKHGEPMPKCQDVPEEYLLDIDNLTNTQWATLEVIAVSYCWLTRDHPDPNGYYLEVLAKMAKLFADGKWDDPNSDETSHKKRTRKEKEYTLHGGEVRKASELAKDGYQFGAGDRRPVGVFLDWTSVPQDKPRGSRTDEETAVFNDALKNMNVWYAHSAILKWKLTFLPEGSERATYDGSGWPFFEECVGSIASPACKVLRIDEGVRLKLLGGWCEPAIDAQSSFHPEGYWDEDRDFDFKKRIYVHPGDYLQLSLDTMDTQRGPPLAPDRFNQMVDEKTFTNGADADAIVKPKYLKTFNAVIVGAEELNYSGLGFDTEKARGVLEVVRTHCKRGTLKRLNLSQSSEEMRVPLDEWAGVAGEMALEGLNLDRCDGVSGSIRSVAGLTHLTELNLARCFGVSGDLENIERLESLIVLNLSCVYGCKGVSGDFAIITGLKHLTKLNLGNCDNVEGDLYCVSSLKKLTELSLYRTGVSGDIRSVAGLTNLTVLNLDECYRVSGHIARVAGLIHLTMLNLHDTRVTAPDGCPKGKDVLGRPGGLNYGVDCGQLLRWLAEHGGYSGIQQQHQVTVELGELKGSRG